MAPRLARLVLANRYDELSRLSSWVADLAQALSLPPKDLFRIDLALTEAVTNSLMHGGMANNLTEAVSLEARADGCMLEVFVSDQGRPFDPTTAAVKAPATTLSNATPGGAGILLLRAYCDELRYSSKQPGNELVMTFRLKESAR